MSVFDLTALRSAIELLEDGLAVVGDVSWLNARDIKVRHTLIAEVIQSFEFVCEIGVKMLCRHTSNPFMPERPLAKPSGR